MDYGNTRMEMGYASAIATIRFMIMCLLMLASAYFQSVFLIGNYAMLIRHSWINVDGMDCSIGIPVTCVLIVFTVIAGFIRFKRFDIIQEEN